MPGGISLDMVAVYRLFCLAATAWGGGKSCGAARLWGSPAWPCKWRWTGRQLRVDSVGAVASPVARSVRREGERQPVQKRRCCSQSNESEPIGANQN